MTITEIIQSEVDKIPAGQIFGYQKFSDYMQSSGAVIKAICRMVSNNKIKRLSKGKFYVANKGLLGPRKPSDSELIRSILYKKGRLVGYETGLYLYNKLGLTTQMPKTITIAYNGSSQIQDFGTIRIKTVTTHIPIEDDNVKLLQYLDVLKGIKKIPDSNINQSLEIMKNYISKLKGKDRTVLLRRAQEFYSPQTRALLGLLLDSLNREIPLYLKRGLNPATIYQLNLDSTIWPMAKNWNIK